MRGTRPAFALLLLLAACGAGEDLGSLDSWAIQLMGLDAPGAAEALIASRADLLVLEPMTSVRGREGFPVADLVAQVRASPGTARKGKLCLAYVNVGQAEDYRTYWRESWRAPEGGTPGDPAFLLGADPAGWAGNWPVAFWDPVWRAILCGGEGSLLDAVLEAGFDGVMLDWVTAWTHPPTAAAAEEAGLDPATAMADLVREVAARGQGRRPGFLVLLNDGAPLLARVPALAGAIDGVVRESVSFAGRPSSDWEDPDNADLPVADTETLVRSLLAARERGVAVLTLDYARRPEHRDQAVRRAREHGFVPCVSRTPLSRLP